LVQHDPVQRKAVTKMKTYFLLMHQTNAKLKLASTFISDCRKTLQVNSSRREGSTYLFYLYGKEFQKQI